MSRLFATVCVLAILVGSVRADTYRFVGRQSTPGNDINCNQKNSDGSPQTFCKICEGITGLADACDANPQCKGFDIEGSYCGYLKGAAGKGKTVYNEGFSHYCKEGVGNSCAGDYIVKKRADIQGNDVKCNAKNYKGERLSFCEVRGNAVDVAAACTANPDCKAFSVQGSSGGYLKTAAGPITYTEGYTTYVKA